MLYPLSYGGSGVERSGALRRPEFLSLPVRILIPVMPTALDIALVLLAAIVVGVGVYAGMVPAEPPKNAEEKKVEAKPADGENVVQMDDPLPAGAALRFGTSRFRYGTVLRSLNSRAGSSSPPADSSLSNSSSASASTPPPPR